MCKGWKNKKDTSVAVASAQGILLFFSDEREFIATEKVRRLRSQCLHFTFISSFLPHFHKELVILQRHSLEKAGIFALPSIFRAFKNLITRILIIWDLGENKRKNLYCLIDKITDVKTHISFTNLKYVHTRALPCCISLDLRIK